MTRRAATTTRVLAIGVGALLAPVLLPAAASADPDYQGWTRTDAVPPAAGLTTEPPFRAAASMLRIGGEESVVRLRTEDRTEVVLVRATLAAAGSTGWHEHIDDSLVVLREGTLRVVAQHGKGHSGCTDQTVEAGTAFAHDAEAHAFVNAGPGAAVFDIVYFVPEGGSPAPKPVDAPAGC
jgi:hypothetical protein